ncbi:MAG TPA: CsgG/HfaB family protein [bacterium]|nr:CsgG/HfaB family protein [bacterium]
MHHRYLLLPALLIAATACFADLPRLAVTDFAVGSDNPKLKYVGKGLAEMIAVNLAASHSIELIDRASRDEILKEQEFSLSGAADASKQLEIGRLLAARYILSGEVLDMDSAVLVSCKITSTETGAIIWFDKNFGPLADYDGISRKLAASALAGMGLSQARSTVGAPSATVSPGAPATQMESREAVILGFSRAVDHFDKGELTEAVTELKAAKEIDPNNAAINFYLAMLTGSSPRFQVDLERFAPVYNPASLGFLEQGAVYGWFSNANTYALGAVPDFGINLTMSHDDIMGLEYYEDFGKLGIGFMMPLGKDAGFSAEVECAGHMGSITSPDDYALTQEAASTMIDTGNVSYGALLGYGYRLMPGLSVGAQVRAAYIDSGIIYEGTGLSIDTDTSNPFHYFPEAAKTYYGFSTGLAYRDGGSLEAEFELIWSNQVEFYIVPPVGGFSISIPGEILMGSVPVVVSAAVTKGLLDKTLFASLRGVGEVGTDARDILAARVIPGLEWWPTQRLAVRAAYEFDYLQATINSATASTSGSGVMAGVTLLVGKLELSVNLEDRFQPLSDLPGNGSNEFAYLIGVVWHGLGERAR